MSGQRRPLAALAPFPFITLSLGPSAVFIADCLSPSSSLCVGEEEIGEEDEEREEEEESRKVMGRKMKQRMRGDEKEDEGGGDGGLEGE